MKHSYRTTLLAGLILLTVFVTAGSVVAPCAYCEDFTKQVTIPLDPSGQATEKLRPLAPEMVAARVNGVPILGMDVNRSVESLKNMLLESRQVPSLDMIPDKYLRQQALDTLIANELMFQESQKMGFSLSDELLDEQIELIKKNTPKDVYQRRIASTDETVFRNSIKKTILITRVVESKMEMDNDSVDEAEVRKYYEELKDSMKRSSTNYRMSHVFAEIPADADEELIQQKRKKITEAKYELDNGTSWSEVVQAYSEAPDTDNDGDIGYYSVEMFKDDIIEGTIPQEVGAVSDVIRSKSGFHIIKVTDIKKKGGYLTYDESFPTLKSMLYGELYKKKLFDMVMDLKKDAKINVYLDIDNEWQQ